MQNATTLEDYQMKFDENEEKRIKGKNLYE